MKYSQELVEWLASGQRGISSDTIVETITGLKATGSYGKCEPQDSGDFWRCEKLLRKVPELRQQLYKMGSVSEGWRKLVLRWDEIVASLEAEVPTAFTRSNIWDKTPKTYKIIQECIRGEK